MAKNFIYKSSLIKTDWLERFYIEMIPADKDLLVEGFEIKDFDMPKFDKRMLKLPSDLFGRCSPMTIDLQFNMMETSAEFNDLLNEPFINIDKYYKTSEADFPVDRIDPADGQQVGHLWIIYSDLGDSGLAQDDFPIYFIGGEKSRLETTYKIDPDSTTQMINIKLMSLDKLVLDLITPQRISDYYKQKITGPNTIDYKKVSEVWEFLYEEDGATVYEQEVTVAVKDINGTGQPSKTAIWDGITLVAGDSLLYENKDGIRIYYIWIHGTSGDVTWGTFTGNQKVGAMFLITKGTYAGKVVTLFNINHPDGSGKLRLAIEFRERDAVEDMIGNVYGKFCAGENQYAHFFRLSTLLTCLTHYGNEFLSLFTRGYDKCPSSFEFIGSPFGHISVGKQSFSSNQTHSGTIAMQDLFFNGFIEKDGSISAGFLYKDKDNEGVFDYKSAWDLLNGLSQGYGSKSVTRISTSTISIHCLALLESVESTKTISVDDIVTIGGEKRATTTVTKDKYHHRGAVMSIQTYGEGQDEYEQLSIGSSSEKDYSKKMPLHTNPVVFTEENSEGDDVTDENMYSISRVRPNDLNIAPEIKTIASKGFDQNQLVYFVQPTIANTEIAILPNSYCEISDGHETYTYGERIVVPEDWVSFNPNSLRILAESVAESGGLAYGVTSFFRDVLSRAGHYGTKIRIKANKHDVSAGDVIDFQISDLMSVPPTTLPVSKTLVLSDVTTSKEGTGVRDIEIWQRGI